MVDSSMRHSHGIQSALRRISSLLLPASVCLSLTGHDDPPRSCQGSKGVVAASLQVQPTNKQHHGRGCNRHQQQQQINSVSGSSTPVIISKLHTVQLPGVPHPCIGCCSWPCTVFRSPLSSRPPEDPRPKQCLQTQTHHGGTHTPSSPSSPPGGAQPLCGWHPHSSALDQDHSMLLAAKPWQQHCCRVCSDCGSSTHQAEVCECQEGV